MLNYGTFLTNIIDFFVIALCIFIFLRVRDRGIKKLLNKEEKKDAKTTRECPYCISTIPIKAVKCSHFTSELPKIKELKVKNGKEKSSTRKDKKNKNK